MSEHFKNQAVIRYQQWIYGMTNKVRALFACCIGRGGAKVAEI